MGQDQCFVYFLVAGLHRFTVVNFLMFAVSAIVVQNEELLFLIETSIRENLSTFNVSCDILTKLIQSSNIVQVSTTKNRFRKQKVLSEKIV